jgi:hypothetical protein
MPMVTIAVYWIAASYVLGIGLAVDQLRRPLPAWEAAGRNRRFWVALTFVMGFHGLGEYAAVAYLVGVVPRFRCAERAGPRRWLQRASAAIVRRGQRAERAMPAARTSTAAQDLALVAALLVFISSFIHSAQVQGHFEQYWLYGAFFAVAAVLQAIWAVLVFRDPLHRRVLVAGAVGNAALIVVWAVSRTVGVPIGPQGWHPEAVGVIDVLSKLDELAAVVLIATVLARLRDTRASISPLYLRLAAMLAGPLFIYSFLAAFGGGGHHH